MIRPALIAFLTLATPCLSEVTFDWAPVGNAGNAADPESGFGAVSYNYAISTTEVTNVQYTAFLNAVDPTGANTLALYNPNMAGDFGGIELQAGNPDGSKFITQAGREQNPVTFISFFDAMRFTNWLHNGQGPGDTETGAYAIGSGLDEVRSADAKFWVPSEDEWYKAAYHDASAGTAGVYFDYATGSNEEPISDSPEDNPAAVNYFNDDGVANGFNDGPAVSGSNPFTDVGAYTAAASPYGTFDQNGNVWEWNEGVISPPSRGLRGGSSYLRYGALSLARGSKFNTRPTRERPSDGFRVATIPEPQTLLLAAVCVAATARPNRSASGPC